MDEIELIHQELPEYGFQTRGLKIKPIPENTEPITWIRDAIDQGLEGMQPDDKVGFTFYSEEFQRGNGLMSFRKREDVTPDDIWQISSNIYQSNSSSLHTETFPMEVTRIRIPRGYFCSECHTSNNNKNGPRCMKKCRICLQYPPCPVSYTIHCNDCHRDFMGNQCLRNHKLKGVCSKYKCCQTCLEIYDTQMKHDCFKRYCKSCRAMEPPSHLCYIPKYTKKETNKFMFIFYDLETRQEEALGNGSFLHEPNICVMKQYCYACINTDLENCSKCGQRVKLFMDNEPISSFMEYILQQRKKNFRDITVISHNAGAFDHQFLLNYILTKKDVTPKLIMNGTELILMQIGKVRFIDSLNYFPIALSKLPASFGFTEQNEGYFPHLFNKQQNQNYIGQIPNIEYYDADNMIVTERNKFMEWHAERINENYSFNFKNEIINYCTSNVEILATACIKFRQLMLDETNICPFTKAVTIASTCNKVYRNKYLEDQTIGLIPKNGYRWKNIQSQIAVRWLVWEEKERGLDIQHAAKPSGEANVEGLVDGYCNQNNEVFEFHGCFYHGCQHMKYDREMEQDTKNHPLSPRDALYGGRTETIVEYYKIKENEKIMYVDIRSLYPWVCKNGKFPKGHPTIYVGNDCKNVDLSSITGLIKCKILPPSDLYHPVLPFELNNKLMFVLCYSCGKSFSSETCTHSEVERCLKSTWVVDEVRKAIVKGYKILKVYEIWVYDSSIDLFTKMMDPFLKIKQESSGWPRNCITTEDKHRYIGEFEEREGIKLEFDKICDNPGLRSIAKLMLNSFWGKFAERDNQENVQIVNQPAVLFAMINDSQRIINTIEPINDETLRVTWENKDDHGYSLPTVNVVIAAYVTALARLKLYTYLEQQQRNVLYTDTDSCIYISKPDKPDILTGEFIGDMTDELEQYGPDSYIVEFASRGPKDYAFKVKTTNRNVETDDNLQTVCKVKGIKLTYAASESINFETTKNMILNSPETPITIECNSIQLLKDHRVITKRTKKTCKLNSTERKFENDHISFPYGYRPNREN